MSLIFPVCVCVNVNIWMFQVPLRADGLKMEPTGAKVEGVKRENADNILTEESDGMYRCAHEFIHECCMSVVYIKITLLLIQEEGMMRKA